MKYLAIKPALISPGSGQRRSYGGAKLTMAIPQALLRPKLKSTHQTVKVY